MELCALAQSYIDRWDSLTGTDCNEFKSSDFGFDFVSRQVIDEEDHIFTISKASVPGLTLE